MSGSASSPRRVLSSVLGAAVEDGGVLSSRDWQTQQPFIDQFLERHPDQTGTPASASRTTWSRSAVHDLDIGDDLQA